MYCAVVFSTLISAGLENLQKLHLDIPVYLALVTFGLKTEVVQRYTNEMKLVETAFGECFTVICIFCMYRTLRTRTL